jgi:hypothetical protein
MKMNSNCKMTGTMGFELWRKGERIYNEEFHNDVTNIGLDTLLNILFGTTTKIATWYMGLIDNAGYTALANADTMASHAGWAEFIGYSQATRVTWGAGAASSQQTTNATAMTFDITASGTVKGGFLTSESTISGATGTLWATALLATAQVVNNGDQIKLIYTVQAARG